MNRLFLCILSLIMVLTIPCVSAFAEDNYSAGDYTRIYINTTDNIGLTLYKSQGYVPTDIVIVSTDGNVIHQSGQVKVRGNSTALAAKKPYTIKFDKGVNVLGMGKAKKWALLASCFDPTFLRNDLALDLGRKISLPYTSDHQYAEMWVDGKYRGCYEIIEPVADGSSRVDIDVDKNNGCGDFLVQYELSRYDDGSVYCNSDNMRFEIKSPDITSEEQLMYVQEELAKIIRIVKTKNFEEIEKVIDVDSFAKYYLINEYFKNVDFGFSSAFFYYKNGLLYAGPPWDYDITAGNLNYLYSENARLCLDTTGLFVANCLFYTYLMECRDFKNAVRHIYAEKYEYFEDIYVSGGVIDQTVAEYQPLFQRNFDDAEWEITTQYDWLMRQPDATYEENVEYLRNWLSDRNDWMSQYFDIYGEDIYELGDINDYGGINVADLIKLQRYVMGMEKFNRAEFLAADLTQDGAVDSYDIVLMRKLVIGNQ
ncbi:MAG: CotH kinase family protein [Ruminococcus sp.]|nr:CotH kinase family protein [Ruminococcus sp.]